MLRLKRHAVTSEGGGSPREFSSGLYAATTCEEIPFPWPRFSDPASRFGPIHAAVAAIPAAALFPFDAATDEGNDFLRMCRRWPEASPAPAAGPPAGSLPDVPVLMLSGQMDLRTPNETARSAAADWPHAQVLTIPNTGHSVLTADFSGCAVGAARRFLRGQSVPARCRGGLPLFYALPPAPLSLTELRAARGVRGARGRAINAVQLTVLDVTLESLSSLFATSKLKLHGGGLRGGRWWVNLGGRNPFLRMRRIEFLPGVFVSGTVHRLGTRRELSTLRAVRAAHPRRHPADRAQDHHRSARRPAGAQPRPRRGGRGRGVRARPDGGARRAGARAASPRQATAPALTCDSPPP